MTKYRIKELKLQTLQAKRQRKALKRKLKLVSKALFAQRKQTKDIKRILKKMRENFEAAKVSPGLDHVHDEHCEHSNGGE